MYEKRMMERLVKMEEAVMELAALGEKQRKLDVAKKEVAETIVGEPYYWGDWKGHVEAHPTDPTKVIANLLHYKTNQNCRWIFDSLTACETVKKSLEFISYEAFRKAEMTSFAKDFEKLLSKYPMEQIEMEVKMQKFCSDHEIDYKDYLKKERF